MQVIGKAIGFDAVADARRAEAQGYDGVRAIDHFFSGIPPATPAAVPHCFTVMAAAAVATERVLLTQTMVAATLRHPFEVAQAIACLDRVSNGRAELGLGTGWLPAEHDAMGLALGTPRERVARVVEAATICRTMFAQDGCVDFDGEIFQAHCDAAWPATPHSPQIMMGAHGPGLIRGAASVADRIDLLESLTGGRPDFSESHLNDTPNLAARIALARSVAADHGRPLHFSATINITVADDVMGRTEARNTVASAAGCDPGVLDHELLRVIDSSDGAIDRIATLASLGIDRLHIRPMDAATQLWLDDALPTIQAIEPATTT